MQYESQDFARCNGNPCFNYCRECKRNLKNSPVNPDAVSQWYMGPWIVEDERCPSYINKETNADSKRTPV